MSYKETQQFSVLDNLKNHSDEWVRTLSSEALNKAEQCSLGNLSGDDFWNECKVLISDANLSNYTTDLQLKTEVFDAVNGVLWTVTGGQIFSDIEGYA